MDRAFLEALYLCGIVLMVILQVDYYQRYSADWEKLLVQKKKRNFLLLLLFGFQVFPFYYLFSSNFDSSDYQLPQWLGIPAFLLFVFFYWLFFKSLSDLGKLWLPGEELKDNLQLVRTGAFRYVRHPMYVSIMSITILQFLMLQNLVIATVAILTVFPFCIYQIRREERMMIQFFGDDYRNYIVQTGMLFPRKKMFPSLIQNFSFRLRLVTSKRKKIKIPKKPW